MSAQSLGAVPGPLATGAPSSFIKSEALGRIKRKTALRTFWWPLVGAVVAVISSFITGVGWLEFAVFALMFAWVTLGLEVGYHRLFAHGAFKAPSWVQGFLWISALMSGQGRGLYWVATHRRHHAYSDTPEDPHSPFFRMGQEGPEELKGLRGAWHAHQGNTYTDYATNVSRFANDLKLNALLMKLDAQFPLWVAFGMVLPALIGLIATQSPLGAWSCFLWGGPLRMFIQHQAYFTNGSFGHMYGEQPFETRDNSRNNWWCAVWTFGSALQNTHHAFPHSAYLKHHWYELDVAGACIKVMSRLGLCSEVRFPDEAAKRAKLRKPVDGVQAVPAATRAESEAQLLGKRDSPTQGNRR